MRELILTEDFKSQYRRLTRRNLRLKKSFDKTLDLLKFDPFYPGLKSHSINQEDIFGNVWSSRVTGDIRILWIFDPDDNLVLILLKTGGHDFVY